MGGKNLLLVSWYHKAEEDSSTSTYKGGASPPSIFRPMIID